MTAIYQLYYQPKDIYLSVPFEGELGNEQQLLPKYTCTRCAVSEPAFTSPLGGDQERQVTDMRITGHRSEEPGARLQNPQLVMNAQNPAHPYRAKDADITATLAQNMSEGFMHAGGGRKSRRAIRRLALKLQKMRDRQKSHPHPAEDL